jgi:hypothetical protein
MVERTSRHVPEQARRIPNAGLALDDGNVVHLQIESSDLDRGDVRENVVVDAASLANAGGGWLLVSSPSAPSRGERQPDAAMRLLAHRIRGVLLNEAKPPLLTTWSIARDEDRTFVVLWVPPAAPLVLTARGEAVSRRDGNVYRMSPEELVGRLGFLRSQDASPVPTSLDDLDPSALVEFLGEAHDNHVSWTSNSPSTTSRAGRLSTLLRLRLVRPAVAPELPKVKPDSVG